MPPENPMPPGLSVISANRLETAALLLCRELAERPLPLFRPEVILTQGPAHSRWLSLAVARVMGVSANLSFYHHNAYLGSVFARVLPEAAQSAEAYSPAALCARIMARLPALLNRPAFAELARYTAGDPGGLRLYSLSTRIADLFDRYLLFRPDMILGWDRGREEGWQALLWREANRGVAAPHRAALLKAFAERLRQGPVEGLDPRITVFGPASLPPFLLRFFSLLAGRTRVLLFQHSPCREFHADSVSARRRLREARQTGGEELPGEGGNPLLASLGRASADFQDLLAEQGLDSEDAHQVPEPESMLAAVQAHVLSDADPAGAGEKQDMDPEDTSLAVCSCHGPMREMEVLHDRILDCLDSDPELSPNDFLVLLPDLPAYAPYIKAVFGGEPGPGARIPYHLAGDYGRRGAGYAEAFFQAMDLAQSRIPAPGVLDLLALPPIREHFKISEDELPDLEAFVRETRIRWARDAEHKENLGLPGVPANTWEAGLSRLLLGYAMLGDGRRMHEGMLPARPLSRDEAELLGRFAAFCRELFAIAGGIPASAACSAWAGLFEGWAGRLLGPDKEQAGFARAVSRMAENESRWGLGQALSLPAALAMLEGFLPGSAAGAGFFRGGVAFAPLRDAAGLPFSVVCLAGMNEDSFPARVRKQNFDRMAKRPQRGDRDPRSEDRLLFLLALLAARKRLIVTYTGQSQKDNHAILPAAPVSELLDYADRIFLCPGEESPRERILTRHRMWAFSPDYFSASGGQKGLFTYRSELSAACRALAGDRGPADAVQPASLPEPSRDISLDGLENFFVNQARFFFKNRLDADLSVLPEPLDSSEPFALEGLDDYGLKESLLHRLLEGGEAEELYSLAAAQGMIPHGNPGRIIFSRAVEAVAPLRDRVAGLMEEPRRLDCELPAAGFRIRASLFPVTARGLLYYRPAKLKAKDLLRAFLRHLALCLAEPEGPCRTLVLGLDGRRAMGRLSRERALLILEGLLDLYARGNERPLAFFPECSRAYAESLHNGEPREKALHKARSLWYNDYSGTGEGADVHTARLFSRDTAFAPGFEDAALAVFGPLMECMEAL